MNGISYPLIRKIFFLIILISMFFNGVISYSEAVESIQVDGADCIQEQTLVFSLSLLTVSSDVEPRIIVEYAGSGFLGSLERSSSLEDATSMVSPRILIEYAGSGFLGSLERSSSLEDATSMVSPRILIEYADFIYQASSLRPVLAETGTLSIITTPVTGEVFVDGISWGTAPQSKVVEVGTYTVTFGDVEDYTTPSSQVAVVIADTTTTIIGTYVEISPSYSIILYDGWNLISIPCIPEDPSIEVMLYDIIGYVESVWAYDGETGYWSSYSSGAPSDLTEMVDGKGYWIKMTTDMVWEIDMV